MGHQYVDYEAACKLSKLETLAERRDSRLLKFSLKCIENPANSYMFPRNARPIGGETFKVNFARTSIHIKSAIPQAQRVLNKYFHVKHSQYKNQ